MINEIILLNKIHKTQLFVRAKARISPQDTVVYTINELDTPAALKLGGVLQKY
jgi:hypothetical protein